MAVCVDAYTLLDEVHPPEGHASRDALWVCRYGWRSHAHKTKVVSGRIGEGYMWYVIQVMSGREGHTVQVMEKGLPDGIMEECFVPMRRLKKKYHGKWQEVTNYG